MGNGEHADVVLGGGQLDAAGDRPQGVDVETGVDLVEHGELALQHGQLQRLVAFLLAAGEIDVQGPGEEALVEADAGGFVEYLIP